MAPSLEQCQQVRTACGQRAEQVPLPPTVVPSGHLCGCMCELGGGDQGHFQVTPKALWVLYPTAGLSADEGGGLAPLPSSSFDPPFFSCSSPWDRRQAPGPTRSPGGTESPGGWGLPLLAAPKGRRGPGRGALRSGEAASWPERVAEGGPGPCRQHHLHRRRRGAGQEIHVPSAGCDL